MFNLIGRLLSGLTTVMTVMGGLAIALMMLHVSLDVGSRFLLNRPLPGTITIVAYYYMLVAAFLPLAYAEQKNAHISVEVLTDLFPERAQSILGEFTRLISIAIFTLLAWRTWEEAQSKHNIGDAVVQGGDTIIVWPAAYLLPVGCALMAMVLTYKFFAFFVGSSGLNETMARPGDPTT